MAFKHGRQATFSVDDSGGTLRDLSSYVNNVDFPQAVDIPDTTTFGATARARTVVGLKDNNFSISGFWDPTATTGPDVVLSGLVGNANTSTFEFQPGGAGAGNVKYSGEARCTQYQTSAAVDGVVPFSASFVVDGNVTRTAL